MPLYSSCGLLGLFPTPATRCDMERHCAYARDAEAQKCAAALGDFGAAVAQQVAQHDARVRDYVTADAVSAKCPLLGEASCRATPLCDFAEGACAGRPFSQEQTDRFDDAFCHSFDASACPVVEGEAFCKLVDGACVANRAAAEPDAAADGAADDESTS